MTLEEARDLIALLAAATKVDQLGPDRQGFWESQFCRLDARQATEAVNIGILGWKFFPSWAEFAEVYTACGKRELDELTARRVKKELETPRAEVPIWIKRFVCARYLYAKFGREQDLRRFPEQGEWGDLNVELMPEDEWATEASRIKDTEALRALRPEAVA